MQAQQLVIIEGVTVGGTELAEGKVFSIAGWEGSDPIIQTDDGQLRLPPNSWQAYTEETPKGTSAPKYSNEVDNREHPQANDNEIGSL